MIHACLPMTGTSGWAVCGRYVALELSRLTDLNLFSEAVGAEEGMDELMLDTLKALRDPRAGALAGGLPIHVDGPVLQALPDSFSFQPLYPQVRGTYRVGYAFFEHNVFRPGVLDVLRDGYEVLATGSTWCSDVLRSQGVRRLATVLQGVDPRLFNPHQHDKTFFRDRFVVFSGGKFELRKGQDLVIRAFKVLQDRHAEVLLVAAWDNPWLPSLITMADSPYLELRPADDCLAMIRATMAHHGVDLAKVKLLRRCPNALAAQYYKNSDVGLFPNRCEGGTNLVLMEYLACGKPAIVSYSSGHRDIVDEGNALLLRKLRRMEVHDAEGVPFAQWDDPDLEEIIESLEWAYQNRAAMAALGDQAGQDLARCTWKETAAAFLDLLRAGLP